MVGGNLTPEDFGTFNPSPIDFRTVVNNGFNLFGGIIFEFLNTFVRQAMTTGQSVTGPLGNNATFSTNENFRITNLDANATNIELLQSISEIATEDLESSLQNTCDTCALLTAITPDEENPIPEVGVTEVNIRITGVTRVTTENCDCETNTINIGEGTSNTENLQSQNNTGNLQDENCGCCCSCPETYWWDTYQICPNSKCKNLTYIKNGVAVFDVPFFNFANASTSPVKTEKVNIIINGKLVTDFYLLENEFSSDGPGRREFYNSSGEIKTFYTGGDTFNL